MNWTGGGLSRHSRNAKGGVTAKQKQHFARARSAQQGVVPQMSSMEWSVFNHIASASRNSSQPKANSFETLGRTRIAQEAVSFEINRLAGESAGREERASKRPHASPRELSQDVSHPASVRPSISGEICLIKCEPGEADESHEANLHFKRQLKRRHSEDSQAERSQHDQSAIHKRRKMLSKIDWVGTNFRKPPDLKYTPPVIIDQIGKRRKVSEGYHARYKQKRREILPAFMTRLPQKDSHEVKSRRNDARISIGGKESHACVSSNSEVGQTPLNSVKRMHGTASSDVMLLDYEETNRQEPSRKHKCHNGAKLTLLIEPERNLPQDANTSGSQCSSSVMLLGEHPPHLMNDSSLTSTRVFIVPRPSLSSRGSYTKSSGGRRKLSSNHSGRTLTTSEIRKLYHDFIGQKDTTIALNATFEGQEEQYFPNLLPQRYGVGLDEFVDGSARKLIAASSDRSSPLSFGDSRETSRDSDHRYLKPEAISRPSSPKSRRNTFQSPLMQHAVAQSSPISQLMQSDASDAEASMLVETGKVELALREAENLDEEVWRSWVLPENEPVDQVSLTPGISVFDAHHGNSWPASTEERSGDSSKQHYPIEDDIGDERNIPDNDEPALQPGTELESYDPLNSTNSRAHAEKQEKKEKCFTRPMTAITPDLDNHREKLDENALWQQFVFTSDPDDDGPTTERQVDLRKLYLVSQEYSEDSSLLAHPSTETDEHSQKPTTALTRSTYDYGGISKLRQSTTSKYSSDSGANERMSPYATQGILTEFSPTVVKTYQREPRDGYTTQATQGSYRSSPDIISTGSPLFGAGLRGLTRQRNGIDFINPPIINGRLISQSLGHSLEKKVPV